MAWFNLAYDFTAKPGTPYSQFKSEALNFGWNPWIRSDSGVWYELPNTTLDGEFADMDAARDAFFAAVARTRAVTGHLLEVERWVISEYNRAKFNADNPRAA